MSVESLEKMKSERNPDLSLVLNQTWFGLPESLESRSLSGFGILCDLCSESSVLYEEE